MKKLIFLIICTLFMTGCYDYQELNNRAIIGGVAVDFIENKIEVTYEIMSTTKSESKENQESKSYYVSGKGETISEAFENANLKLNKEPTFSHIKVMVFSEEIAKEKMEFIIDYIIREPEIYNIFHPVIAKDVEAKEILKTTNKDNPVASTSIEDLLENNKGSNTVTTDIKFEKLLNNMLDSKMDAYTNVIKKEDNTLKIEGIALFKDYQMITLLNSEQSSTFNVLNNNSPNYYFKMKCPDKEEYISFNLYRNNKTEIEIKDNKIEIKSNLEASVMEDNCKVDFASPEVYDKWNSLLKEELTKKFESVYEIIKNNQTDVLEIQNKYYKKTRNELTNWYELETIFNSNIIINKNGLIFEVKENE